MFVLYTTVYSYTVHSFGSCFSLASLSVGTWCAGSVSGDGIYQRTVPVLQLQGFISQWIHCTVKLNQKTTFREVLKWVVIESRAKLIAEWCVFIKLDGDVACRCVFALLADHYFGNNRGRYQSVTEYSRAAQFSIGSVASGKGKTTAAVCLMYLFTAKCTCS